MTTHHDNPIAADLIADLTQPFTTTETITQPVQSPRGRWRTQTFRHTVQHAGLLNQIQLTITTTSNAGELHHTAYGPKPAGRIDCLAFLQRIEHQSSAMANELLLPPQPLNPRLLALAGLIGNHPDTRVHAWWTTARVLTQHDAPPYSPDVPCPNERCDHRGSLRVRVDDRIAVCIECHDTWSDTQDDPSKTFGRLAMWVKWAFIHLHGPHHYTVADDDTGHPGLGHTVECLECASERAAAATRAASRALGTHPSPPRPSQADSGTPHVDSTTGTQHTGLIGTAMPTATPASGRHRRRTSWAGQRTPPSPPAPASKTAPPSSATGTPSSNATRSSAS